MFGLDGNTLLRILLAQVDASVCQRQGLVRKRSENRRALALDIRCELVPGRA